MGQSLLAEWIESQIGRDGRFRSARQWSIAAGLNQNAVTMVMERGRGDPETLIKIGTPAGKTPREMFELAGWLEEEGATGDLTGAEAELLDLFRRTEPALQRVALAGLRASVEPPRGD